MSRALPKVVLPLALLVFAGCFFPAPSANAAELPAVMVLNIKHEEDAGPGIAKILTELVLQELHDLGKFRVVGEKDVDQMLNTEQRKQLAGCTDTSCLIEIAGAMGTKYTLDGTVGVVGSSNVLSLSLIDVTKATVVSKKTTVVKGEREHLLEAVHRLVGELIGPVLSGSDVGAVRVGAAGAKRNPPVPAGPPAPTAHATVSPPINPYRLWGHVGMWGGVGVVGLGGVFAILASKSADDYNSGKDTEGAKSSINTNNTLAVAGFVVGAVSMATGAVLWYLDPGDEKWAKDHPVSFGPILTPEQFGFAITGGW